MALTLGREPFYTPKDSTIGDKLLIIGPNTVEGESFFTPKNLNEVKGSLTINY